MKVTVFENDVPRLVNLDEALYIIESNKTESLSIDWQGEYSRKSEDGLIRLSGLIVFPVEYEEIKEYYDDEFFDLYPWAWCVLGNHGCCYVLSYCSALTTENYHSWQKIISKEYHGEACNDNISWFNPIEAPTEEVRTVWVNTKPKDICRMKMGQKSGFSSVLPSISTVLEEHYRKVSFVQDPETLSYFQEINDFWLPWCDRNKKKGERSKMTSLLMKISLGSGIDSWIADFYIFTLRKKFSNTFWSHRDYLDAVLNTAPHLRDQNSAYCQPLYNYGEESDKKVVRELDKRWGSEIDDEDKSDVEIIYGKAETFFRSGVTSYRVTDYLLSRYLPLGEHLITRIVSSVYLTYDPGLFGSERDKNFF